MEKSMNDKDMIDLIARQITEDALIFNEAEEHNTDKKYVIETSRSFAPIWRERRKLISKIKALEPYAETFNNPLYAKDPTRQLRIEPNVLGDDGGYFTKYQYDQLAQRLQEQLSLIERRIRIPAAQQEIKTIYADHCRYATSPLSGIRYLIVGIDRIAKSQTSPWHKTSRQLKKHWTYKLRDFYNWTYDRSYMNEPTNVKVRRLFNAILTIKAENILSVNKLYEDEE